MPCWPTQKLYTGMTFRKHLDSCSMSKFQAQILTTILLQLHHNCVYLWNMECYTGRHNPSAVAIQLSEIFDVEIFSLSKISTREGLDIGKNIAHFSTASRWYFIKKTCFHTQSRNSTPILHTLHTVQNAQKQSSSCMTVDTIYQVITIYRVDLLYEYSTLYFMNVNFNIPIVGLIIIQLIKFSTLTKTTVLQCRQSRFIPTDSISKQWQLLKELSVLGFTLFA